MREIGTEAFCYCKNLRKLVFRKIGKKAPAPQPYSGQPQVIRTRAFYGCGSLAVIELPDTLEEIGIDAFRESGLESITIPEAVKTIR